MFASFAHVRAKLRDNPLSDEQMREIIGDIVAGHYSPIQIAAFVAACAGTRLDVPEITSLARAMVDTGQRLTWPDGKTLDKHSIGGLPGNRTTMILVPIVAAAGCRIPKTSSRAITSPSGTADTMETLAPVELDLAAMRRVVEREGACIVWGGAVSLSPADDVIIRVERPLNLDGEGQMIASVLAKKAAAGATHVVIDLPVGPTAKVRRDDEATHISSQFVEVAQALGLAATVVRTDGRQPVGRGIGPALEARDVLAVLRGDSAAPGDLRERALTLTGALFELTGVTPPGEGVARARALLDSGAAWKKFQAICDAQGGMREPPTSDHTRPWFAPRAGRVTGIDNRRLARLAKLTGAPRQPAAGLTLHVSLGSPVARGEPLCTLHAESSGELAYALEYAAANSDLIRIDGDEL
jgi:thymidine phosphorylase